MAIVMMARGDRLPVLELQLRNENGVAVNLTGAGSVVFTMTHERTRRVVTGVADIVDADEGRVRYEWAAGDTDVGGYYIAKVVVTFGGLAMTFPSCPERRELLVEICG